MVDILHKVEKVDLKSIVEKINGKAKADNMYITSPKPLDTAGKGEISFFHNAAYIDSLKKTKASVVILEEQYAQHLPEKCIAIIHPAPQAAWAVVLDLFYPNALNTWKMKVDVTRVFVDKTAIIGKNTFIAPGAFIGANVVIGDNCQIGPNVSIVCATIGNNVIIHPGASIGQDGFAFAASKIGIVKVPQVGRVVIGSFVEIGANTTIDRGTITNTIIGDYTKIDNLVQIAHGVQIGKGCLIVSQAGIAGSTKIGHGVVIGGQSGVSGHIAIADGTTIAARSGVMRHQLEPKQTLGGFPARPIEEWRRLQAKLNKLLKAKKED